MTQVNDSAQRLNELQQQIEESRSRLLEAKHELEAKHRQVRSDKSRRS